MGEGEYESMGEGMGEGTVMHLLTEVEKEEDSTHRERWKNSTV